jgi:hypothetical protein
MPVLSAAVVEGGAIVDTQHIEFESMHQLEQVALDFARNQIHSMLLETAHWKYRERKKDPIDYNSAFVDELHQKHFACFKHIPYDVGVCMAIDKCPGVYNRSHPDETYIIDWKSPDLIPVDDFCFATFLGRIQNKE